MKTGCDRRFLTARWVHLIIASHEVDPGILRARVPRGTDLDLWAGKCFVSVVGFQFLDTRVLGIPVPFHRDFEEVNLRFYVRRVVGGEVRRGVVFLKEIVGLHAVAWIANALYHEKYVVLPMSHADRTGESPPSLVYRWRHRGRWSHLAATLDGDPYRPDENSEEMFITEHPWGYTSRRDGSTLEYRVEHPRWKVWRGRDPELVCDVEALYGREFVPYLEERPSSCYVADGSEVVVRRGLPL
jgi:uncharacterized protein YqjF (DUF2071 family)